MRIEHNLLLLYVSHIKLQLRVGRVLTQIVRRQLSLSESERLGMFLSVCWNHIRASIYFNLIHYLTSLPVHGTSNNMRVSDSAWHCKYGLINLKGYGQFEAVITKIKAFFLIHQLIFGTNPDSLIPRFAILTVRRFLLIIIIDTTRALSFSGPCI